LVDQKILFGLLASSQLVDLKKFVWPFGYFLACLRWKIFLCRKILLFYFFGNTFSKRFDKCYIRPTYVLML